MTPRFRFVLPAAVALTVALALTAVPGSASAQEESAPVYLQDNPQVHQLKVLRNLRGARRHLWSQKGFQSSHPLLRRPKGVRVRRTVLDDLPVPDASLRAGLRPGPAGPSQLLAIPSNVPVSSPVGDNFGEGQAEQMAALHGSFGLAGWNDGHGFSVGPDVQGVGYTTNGGSSWVDAGSPPKAGSAITAWSSDPVVTVNPNTGEFWFCALVDAGTTANGIGVIKATFPGGVMTWGTPVVARSVSNSTTFIDKQWLWCDPTTGNLYISFTEFTATTGHIRMIRSTNGGASWSAPLTLTSASAGSGFLAQGSRVHSDKVGNVYVAWYQIGATAEDFVKLRRSTNAGVSFTAEVNATSFYANFGVGAPGFNRLGSVDFPSVWADRSNATTANRLYVAWHESVNFYDDPLGGGGAKSETEPNNGAGQATPFTPGQVLRGSLAGTSGFDYFSFAATQGTDYIFYCDSLGAGMVYTMRVFCSDGGTVLATSGSDQPGGGSVLVWSAPATATYYLRLATITGGTPAGYRIQTGVNTGGPERGRDQRDVFVTNTDNGTSFSTPVRVNDDSGWFDNWLPEVTVPRDGYPYVEWYDWRSTACGGTSHIMASRSSDGGATWAASQLVTDTPTAWTGVSSNIAPNQGDYLGFYGGDAVAFSWADGRLGDPDVYFAKLIPTFTLSGCPPGTIAVPNLALPLNYLVTNQNAMFGDNLNWALTGDRAWPTLPQGGVLAVSAGGSSALPLSVTVPDSAANGPVKLCLVVSQPNGAKSDTCCATFTVDRPVAALASVSHATADVGGASVSWFVSSDGPVTVQRATRGSAWAPLATVVPHGDGAVAFRDAAVVAGAEYGYRLGIVSGGGEVTAGEVWLRIPAAAAFALDGALRNPVIGEDLAIAFSLPDGAPARVDLIDLSGRRVAGREVGSLGAGHHVVSLGREGGHLPAGVYLVRLARGGESLQAKLTIVR